MRQWSFISVSAGSHCKQPLKLYDLEAIEIEMLSMGQNHRVGKQRETGPVLY